MREDSLMIFIFEIEKQCSFALIANENLKQTIRTITEGDFPQNMNCAWYSIQAFLVAAGNISKLLWPANVKFQERGVRLRKVFGVLDDSPLQARTFRNHFEHFDERLEKWIDEKGSGYKDCNIGSASKMFGNIDYSKYMRHYDPTTEVVIFRGEEYDMRPVVDAILELQNKASVEIKKWFFSIEGP